MAKQPTPAGKKGGTPQSLVWTLVIAGILVATSLPTVILVFFGLMPTLVAFITDRSKGKAATFCVGGMNFCGLLPWLLDLWTGSHTIGAAMGTLTNAIALLVIFGAAAFGWALYLLVPQVVVSILTVTSQHKVAALRTEQKNMIEEWGAEVAAHATAHAAAQTAAEKPQRKA